MVAILDKDDQWHALCADAFTYVNLPLLTSEAVLTELFHFMGPRSRKFEAALNFVRSGVLTIGAVGDPDLPNLMRLMRQYRDCPMDFADATLVHLAERESLNTILTVDVSDFETYRIEGRKRFRILPASRPPR
jgi:hypothetical protein